MFIADQRIRMSEYLKEIESIPKAFFQIAKEQSANTLFMQSKIQEDGTRYWQPTSYGQAAKNIARIANYLLNLGVRKGDKIAIISCTRQEWTEIDLAILSLGAVNVAVYPTLFRDEVGFILYDSQAKIIFAENQEQISKLQALQGSNIEIPEIEDRPAHSTVLEIGQIIAIEDIEEKSSKLKIVQLQSILKDETLPSTPPSTIKDIVREDLASIVYTSGTTGPPKGVLQTHGNHLSNLWQCSIIDDFFEAPDFFLFLPLSHSFARFFQYAGVLATPVLKFPAVPDKKTSKFIVESVLKDMQSADFSIIPSVPRIFEKIMAGIENRASAKSIQGRLLNMCIKSSLEHYTCRMNGKIPSLLTRIIYQGTAAIREQIKIKIVGRNFRAAITGGAKLSPEVNRFFDAIGMKIYAGYGLTETVVVTNFNTPEQDRIGSVGPTIRELDIKIASDGEILFKGPNVAKGYFNRPKASAESWDSEGWFHTGDIGHIDQDGFLFITDRKKDLIVTAGGKKIPPAVLESKFKGSQVISQIVIYGEGRPYCVALVTINPEAFKNLPPETNFEKLVHEEIEKSNATLASYETIKKFKILPEDFSIDNGLLTPTLKVKRKEVYKRFNDIIDQLYA